METKSPITIAGLFKDGPPLSPFELDLINGRVCECGSIPELKDSAFIYNGRSYGPVYHCGSCGRHVGVHPPSKHESAGKPLGRLANQELRTWKKSAHAAFDKIWKENHMGRTWAYKFLSEQLGVKKMYCHIGMFDVELCKRTIEVCNEFLKNK